MGIFTKSEPQRVIKALKSNSISKPGRLIELIKTSPLEAWNKDSLELLIFRALEHENTQAMLLILKNFPLQIIRENFRDRAINFISRGSVDISAEDLIRIIPSNIMNKKYILTIIKNKESLNIETALEIIPGKLIDDDRIIEALIEKSETYIPADLALNMTQHSLPLEIFVKLFGKIEADEHVYFLNNLDEKHVPDLFVKSILKSSYADEFELIMPLSIALKVQGLDFLEIIRENNKIQPDEIFRLIPQRLHSSRLIIGVMSCFNSSSDIPIYYSQIPVNTLSSEICFAALKACYNETTTGSAYSEGIQHDTMRSQMDSILKYTPQEFITDEIKEFYEKYKDEGRSRFNDSE